jgi:3-hydroxyacyl-CoA dehydrogenase/enoyl-CoA hydratase/3-hydroxybutyryl-CoA epimerase
MLAEGVPATMIENAAKMAGMPVGPLSLNDEVAVDLSQKIMKASIADLGPNREAGAHGAHQQAGRRPGSPRPQERQGLLRISG